MNMTYVKFVDLGVYTTVWTSAITPGHPILVKKWFENKKIEKRVNKIFPLLILSILCIFWSKSIEFKEALPVISQR